MPIDAPKNRWTWVDFPESTCNEGTPTGLGINPADSKNVLIFLNGGGACWDYVTCFVVNAAVKGPFRKAEFERLIGNAGSTILGRDQGNPFRDWNLVFIPYCTGDVHAGDNVVTYEGFGERQQFRHAGRTNLVAFLKRLAATWPEPAKLVISGSSAGGYGSSFNYDLVRTYFPKGQVYLLNDSGPVLKGDDIRKDLRDAWYRSWRLDKGLAELCPGCQQDLTAIVPIMARRYPNDRFALLSYLQDGTIARYFQQTPQQFEMNLQRMAAQVLDPLPAFRYYFRAGQNHVMLFNPASHSVGGVRLLDWLGQLVADDPTWRSVKP
jgi:hypothetical protein